jgi:adenylosuccinate synthase
MKLLDAKRVIVVDLGFGDAGKGTVVDYLCRRLGAPAVVRFNGGAQAGHNVVLEDGRHHTFAQLGAGSFIAGVQTFLSKHVVLHPTALLVEAEHLARVGVGDALARARVSEECLVTTPIHQAANCVRELARGQARHGSCGVGVGETVRDALNRPTEALRASDLHDLASLTVKVLRQQEAKRHELVAELRALGAHDLARPEVAILSDPSAVRRWAERAQTVAALGVIRDDAELRDLLARDEPVVFEGAQGVLLDEWVGFHPHTTWSTCTWANAEALLREHASAHAPFRLGVLRTYPTRHGAGPFPTETTEAPPRRTTEHNIEGPWQGAFRTGLFDAALGRYALAAAGAADGLAVTHLDRVARGEAFRIATELDVGAHPSPALFALSPTGSARDLRVGSWRDLAHVEALGIALASAVPIYRAIEAPTEDTTPAVIPAIEDALAVEVVLTSSGPTAREKQLTR